MDSVVTSVALTDINENNCFVCFESYSITAAIEVKLVPCSHTIW